jgi:spore coat protein A
VKNTSDLKMRRREFLELGLWSSAGILARPKSALGLVPSAFGLAQSAAKSEEPLGPSALQSYVTPLAIPQSIRTTSGQHLSIPIRQGLQKAHRDLKPTRIWGYNSTWPGPTVRVRSGQPLTVKWHNELPTRHFLPIDHSLHGAEEGLPESRTVAHLHGAQVMPDSDGYPESWFTADGKTGPTYLPTPCHYPNKQSAATLWYHDHAMGINRINIYAGLAGFYIIEDDMEEQLNLPSGAYDIPLMLQDRSFNADGSLHYPVAHNGTHPVWIQEFFGSVNCVNGVASPYLEVEPRKYRFRLLNASNSRFYHLSMVPSDENGSTTGKPREAPPFYQVGADSGLLPAPLPLHYLIVSPGERFDLVIDFSEHRGKNLAIVNDAPAPYPRGGELVSREVMLFRVTKNLSGKDTSSLPNVLAPFTPLNPDDAVRERFLAISEMERPSDGYTAMGMLDEKHWSDPVTETPKAGSTEIWSFANTTGDIHPIHVHLVKFQVLNRQPFDPASYLQNQKVVFAGAPRAPEANERPAWKDTVKTYPGTITRVIAKFDLPEGTQVTPGTALRYVWHCHMLEHEDNEMMRPYDVIV